MPVIQHTLDISTSETVVIMTSVLTEPGPSSKPRRLAGAVLSHNPLIMILLLLLLPLYWPSVQRDVLPTMTHSGAPAARGSHRPSLVSLTAHWLEWWWAAAGCLL